MLLENVGEPEGAKRSQREPEGTKREPKGTKREPKGATSPLKTHLKFTKISPLGFAKKTLPRGVFGEYVH